MSRWLIEALFTKYHNLLIYQSYKTPEPAAKLEAYTHKKKGN